VLLSAFPLRGPEARCKARGRQDVLHGRSAPREAAADSSEHPSRNHHTRRQARNRHQQQRQHQKQQQQQQQPQPEPEPQLQSQKEDQCPHKHKLKPSRRYSGTHQQQHTQGQEWQQARLQPHHRQNQPQELDKQQSHPAPRLHSHGHIRQHQQPFHQTSHQLQQFHPCSHQEQQQNQQQQQQEQRPRRSSRAPPAALHIPSEDLPQDLPGCFLPHVPDWSSSTVCSTGAWPRWHTAALPKPPPCPGERDRPSTPAWGTAPGAAPGQEVAWKGAVQPLDRTQSLLPLVSETPGARSAQPCRF